MRGVNNQLGSILKSLLPNNFSPVISDKVIHDPLWGSRLFYKWEVALIDTLLLQRLRQITQLGTAYLTYPSAVHTRFSHSLGVAILAGRLITRIRERQRIQKKEEIHISEKDIYTVRIAGLLHDIGHCFFSHCSEAFTKESLKDEQEKLGIQSASPHEALAYLIITNEYFTNFWKQNVVPLFSKKTDAPNLSHIASIVVKKTISKQKRYLTDIISGPFDVDKLEYLYRDARMAGLEISYDIERYLYKIKVVKQKDGNVRLAMDFAGLRAIEQIIFSKLMLFSFVYHHQKVLAADCLIQDLLYELLHGKRKKKDIKAKTPIEFLRYTEYELLGRVVKGPSKKFDEIKELVLSRKLPKRCFVLNSEFVINLDKDEEVEDSWERLKDDFQDINGRQLKIRKEIAKKLKVGLKNQKITEKNVYINMPIIPTMREATFGNILTPNKKIEAVGKYVDIRKWLDLYELKKYRGYIFVSEEIRDEAQDLIEEYLYSKYNLKFKENAKIEANIKT